MSQLIEVRADGSRRVALICDEPSLTKQSAKDECDINAIMKKYERTKLVSHINQNPGFYDDVSEVPDYQGALAVVSQAHDMFASMPAQLRARFQNDPGVFLSFVADPLNADELVQLGLAVTSVKVEPKVPASEPPAGVK